MVLTLLKSLPFLLFLAILGSSLSWGGARLKTAAKEAIFYVVFAQKNFNKAKIGDLFPRSLPMKSAIFVLFPP